MAAFPAGAPDALQEYLRGECLILYTVTGEPETVDLLSIRHHRQLTFDFSKIWPSGLSGQPH